MHYHYMLGIGFVMHLAFQFQLQTVCHANITHLVIPGEENL